MIITLLSDFGLQDNFIAVAKGVLLQSLPEVVIVDLNHEIQPYNKLQCGYQLKSAFTNFPPNTVHLVLFDALPHPQSQLLATKVNDQIILCADNGLLPLTFFGELGKVYTNGKNAGNYLECLHQAATFIKDFKAKDFSFEGLAEIVPEQAYTQMKPSVKENSIECQVIHVDRFENVVLNITQSEFEEHRAGRQFRILLPGRNTLSEISNSYGDVSENTVLCLFNSAGFLEVAINKGHASSLLGLKYAKPKQMVYQQVKIEFS